jgi:hypothetical protein
VPQPLRVQLLDEPRADGAVLRPDGDGDAASTVSAARGAVADGLDVGAGLDLIGTDAHQRDKALLYFQTGAHRMRFA